MSFYKAAGDEIKTIRSSEDEANAYTLFMPTNTAFGELEQDLYTCLLKPENKERVLELIKYHVVRGTQLSSTGGFAKAYPEADTVPTLATSFDDNSVVFTNRFFNPEVPDNRNPAVLCGEDKLEAEGADLTGAMNVLCTNGAVHCITKVLVPPGFACGCENTRSLPPCSNQPHTLEP